MDEPRIELGELDPLYERLSKDFGLNLPDFVVSKLVLKQVGSIRYWGHENIGGNVDEKNHKRQFHSANALGEYLGSEDIIELIVDSNQQLSVITAIHEFLHYRNKHKKIIMSEDEVEREAQILRKKYGY